MKNTNFIGQFKTKSNVIRVTDPCYERGTWCAGCIEDAKIGTWEVRINTFSDRIAELHAYHVDIKNDTIKNSSWTEQDFEVGVDSGQCGIFDDDIYPFGETGEYGDDNTFYGKCCNLSMNGVGVMDFGVVSSSGYGDGSYVCYTLEEKGQTVGIKVIFIENDYEDDYDEQDDYEDDYEDDII